MTNQARRQFFSDLGKGMLLATLGPTVAAEFGLPRALADGPKAKLSFGTLEPLVALIEETPCDRVLPILVRRLREGTTLRDLVAAAALASARTQANADYSGMHAFLALAPSFAMARQSPRDRQALPVLEVVLHNADRIHDPRGRGRARLRPVEAATLPQSHSGSELLRAAARQEEAERILAALLTRESSREVYDDVLSCAIERTIDVHAIVTVWRAWDMLEMTGKAHATTMLRQAVTAGGKDEEFAPRMVELFDKHRLDRPRATRRAEDSWVDKMSRTIFGAGRREAIGAVASALADGIDPDAVGEAISLAASLVMLHDPGVEQGHVHGGHAGVHASDAANAWRNIARVSNERNAKASLLAAAWYVGGARDGGITAGGRYMTDGGLKHPYPLAEHLEAIRTREPAALLRTLDGAIRENDQGRACAAVRRYGECGYESGPVIDLLLSYATSEEGHDHAEKYYRTATEEFATTRAALRWRHLVALARVTASEYGWLGGKRGHDPGYEQACDLLGLKRTPQ
jgi:hypothetical protein